MLFERYNLWDNDEYNYPEAFGFRPNIHTYLHEDDQLRSCMIIVPGGGYGGVSPSEGELVAKKFYSMGYQSVVLTYTTNFLKKTPLKKQPLRDLLRTVRYVRSHAKKWHIDPAQVLVMGFSAGAHLAGSAAVHWMDIEETNPKYIGISGKPSGAILSYPVISAGEYAHKDSFLALLGADADEEEIAYMSLEKQVTCDTVPIFLWHTVTDEEVSVENSYLLAAALRSNGIPYEQHVFPRGSHGLSLADQDWEDGNFGDPYTLEQTLMLASAVNRGAVEVDPMQKIFLEHMEAFAKGETVMIPGRTAVPEVAVWPDLADTWVKTLG